MSEAPIQMPPENPLARKSDIAEAKQDLRREMRLSLLAGSTLGTTLSGVLGVLIAKNPAQATEVAAKALTAFPLL